MSTEQIIKDIGENPRIACVLNTEQLREFAEWAAKGEAMPVRKSLHYMAVGYMENCGISPIPRTLYFEAGECLCKREQIGACSCMPSAAKYRRRQQFFKRLTGKRESLSVESFADDSEEFGTTRLDQDEFLIYCMTECSFNIPDDMKAALCYGIFLKLTNHKYKTK